MDFKKYISIDSEKLFGKPIITGTRISAYDVLNCLANGMSKEEILQDFPELSDVHIQACLTFAADRENKIRVAS